MYVACTIPVWLQKFSEDVDKLLLMVSALQFSQTGIKLGPVGPVFDF